MPDTAACGAWGLWRASTGAACPSRLSNRGAEPSSFKASKPGVELGGDVEPSTAGIWVGTPGFPPSPPPTAERVSILLAYLTPTQPHPHQIPGATWKLRGVSPPLSSSELG